ncbi:hypothetical protein [Burkholderia lata]|uniref:hypothetical protein n=1 Tax=Burkholderia lata (strain ATCC 17760 / DSM 23089 / LMG 22485 / NCIMB 9086 / R18194 / 383) TaxID=482957 RepID=UPI00399B0E9D
MAVGSGNRAPPTLAHRGSCTENPSRIKSLADRPVRWRRLARFLSYPSRLQMQNPIEDTP